MTSTNVPNVDTPGAASWWSTVVLWLKRNWFIFLVVGGGVWAFFVLRQKSETLERTLGLYQRQSDDYKRQIDEIRKLRDEERVRQQQIERTYQETLTTIRTEHADQVRVLNSQKKEELKRIIAETHGGDPDLMAERVNRLFGIPIVRVSP